MKVYQVLWYENDCSGTVSLHRSLEGAIKGIEDYKGKLSDFNWRNTYRPNDWTLAGAVLGLSRKICWTEK